MIEKSEAVIIGGGIAGISLAAVLSQDMSVTLLERETALGYHSTGRSAAIFIKNYGNATLRALNARSEGYLKNPNPQTNGSVLSKRGELLIATADEMPVLHDYYAGSSDLQMIEPAHISQLVPILKTDQIAGAVYEENAMDIDVDRLMQGYTKQARAQGVNIVLNADIRAIERRGNTWRVDTSHHQIETPIVINAAGAWGDHIATLAGLAPLGLQPMRRSAAMITVPAPYDCMSWPLFGSINENWYAKPMGGKLMVSPAEEDPIPAQDAYPDDMVLAEGLWRFEMATTLPLSRPTHSWAGLRTFLPDRTPAVGFDPMANGFFWLVGQGGYGVQTSPAMAQLAADLINGTQTAQDRDIIAALAPARFRGIK